MRSMYGYKISLMSCIEQGKFAELSPDEPGKLLRDADGVVMLPKQLWSVFKEHGDGEFLCEVGWVLGGDSTVTSRSVLCKDGDVKASILNFQLPTLGMQHFRQLHTGLIGFYVE
uniref:Uncharacterized protein n=1 Tax=Arundo donax TaxID=35708 RepID=A0A0A9D6L6_ARUDO